MSIPSLRTSTSLSTHDQATLDDLLFLDAWEKGLVPWSNTPSVLLRIRQIRRANLAQKDDSVSKAATITKPGMR